jgi:hypothetical protein
MKRSRNEGVKGRERDRSEWLAVPQEHRMNLVEKSWHNMQNVISRRSNDSLCELQSGQP